MDNLSRDKAKKYHQERISKLMAKTRVDNQTAFDVLDEGTTHLIDHFKPANKPEAQFDHALIIGSAYLGEHINDPATKIRACSFFCVGDIHELSHTIADVMRDDKQFAQAIFHACEVFALHEPRKKDE